MSEKSKVLPSGYRAGMERPNMSPVVFATEARRHARDGLILWQPKGWVIAAIVSAFSVGVSAVVTAIREGPSPAITALLTAVAVWVLYGAAVVLEYAWRRARAPSDVLGTRLTGAGKWIDGRETELVEENRFLRAHLENTTRHEWEKLHRDIRDGARGFDHSMKHVYSLYRRDNDPSLPERWQEAVAAAPWPVMGLTPAKDWHFHLQGDERSRALYAFAFNWAQVVERLGTMSSNVVQPFHEIDTYRRGALDHFRALGRMLSEKKPGLNALVAEVELPKGFAPIVRVLAYLDIAKGAVQQSLVRGDAFRHFWDLGNEWHADHPQILGPDRPKAHNDT